MRAAVYAAKYPHKPQIVQNALKNKLDWWFSPELFWTFCRENRITVLPMFNAESYYNVSDNKAYYIVNKPEHYRAAAKEAAAYVKYLKEKGYLSMAKVWEIGNECYLKGWKPAEYAAYVKCLIKAVCQVQPDIKLAIPVFICTRDNPDVKAIMKRLEVTSLRGGKTEWQIYDQAMKWTAGVIESLGKDAQKISYGIQHSYGAGPAYNSNYKGIDSTYRLLQAFPGSRKWRLINTEWRDRSGENLWCHRAFWNSALWKGKFVMLMMAYPHMDYTGAHSLFAFSGGLYWSNGKRWQLQFNPARQIMYDSGNIDGKPRFDIGAFGPLAKMCNDLIDTHPKLLLHHSGMGKMSSAYYYDSFRANRTNPKAAVKSDLDYIVAAGSNYDSLALLVVNTKATEVKLRIKSVFGKADIGAAEIELLKSKAGMLDMLQIPGSGFYPWEVTRYGQNMQGSLVVPPNSVLKAVFPFKFTAEALPQGTNLIPDAVSGRIPAGVNGLSGAKLKSEAGGGISVSNPSEAKTVYVQIPSGAINSGGKYSLSLKHRSLKQKVLCSILVAGQNWSKIASNKFYASGNKKRSELKFELKAGAKVKLIRINIYDLKKDNKLLLSDITLSRTQDK